MGKPLSHKSLTFAECASQERVLTNKLYGDARFGNGKIPSVTELPLDQRIPVGTRFEKVFKHVPDDWMFASYIISESGMDRVDVSDCLNKLRLRGVVERTQFREVNPETKHKAYKWRRVEALRRGKTQ